MTAIAAQQPSLITPQQPVALVPASGSANSGGAFSMILDAVNPLQHIPVVSGIVRAVQGTSISPVSQVAGDTLYGGLIGGAISSFAGSVATIAVKAVTGKDIGEHVVATLAGTSENTASSSTATALVPIAAGGISPSSQQVAALKGNVDDAAHTILRDTIHPERVAAQYQRAQTLDIGHKLLAKSL